MLVFKLYKIHGLLGWHFCKKKIKTIFYTYLFHTINNRKNKAPSPLQKKKTQTILLTRLDFLHDLYYTNFVVKLWDTEKCGENKIIKILLFNLQELRLPPKAPSTTAIPYVYTTAKPRRKQHSGHNSKTGHDTSRIKETLIPNLIQDNEIVGSVEGKVFRNENGYLL